MNQSIRLRRGGVIMMAAAATMALSACNDGFFFDPADGRVTPISVQWSLVAPGAAAAAGAMGGPQGAEGPMASPGAVFDRADGAHVVLRLTERELFNQRVALEASGSDKKVSFHVELPAGGAVSATLQLTLLEGTTELFSGTTSVTLTPGLVAEVDVPMSGVVAGVTLEGGPFVVRSLGGTIKLTATGLFATGDAVGPVTATYRALDATVSVASDGTVTAVSNGTGRVEASYLGRADTAVVTVEDRCYGPYILLAVGQLANGTLEANDCEDAANFAYNDWYEVVLNTAMLVRATLTGDGFEPFVGVSEPDKWVVAVAASQEQSVTTEFAFPPGTYLVRAGSRSRTAGPIPTGSYSLALSTASEPQEGCFAGSTSSGATWVVDGIFLSGRLAPDDCGVGDVRQDVYAGRMSGGDTAVVTVDGDFGYRFAYLGDVRAAPLSGGRVQWAFTSDDERSHHLSLRTSAAGPFGNYTIRIDGEIPADYDACANPPILMGIGASGSPQTKTGRLQRRIDCEERDRVRDTYRVTAPSGAFRTTLESSDFDPFVAVSTGSGRTGWGRSSTTGSVTAEHVYPAGGTFEVRATHAALLSAAGRHEGAFTLSTEGVATPQEGCIGTTFVFFGSSASGRITSDDCEDEFDNEPDIVRRWDGYSVLLMPGETVSVSLSPDFRSRFTHWVGGNFFQAHPVVEPGQTGTLVVTNDTGSAVFHAFYPITDAHNGTGNYTISFSGTPSAGPAAAAGAGRVETSPLAHVEPRGGSRPQAR